MRVKNSNRPTRKLEIALKPKLVTPTIDHASLLDQTISFTKHRIEQLMDKSFAKIDKAKPKGLSLQDYQLLHQMRTEFSRNSGYL